MADTVGPQGGAEHEFRLDLTTRMMLQLEGRPFKYAGAKQEAIRSTLHMSSAEYHQRLNSVIDSEEALAYAPMVVRRLRRARSGRLPTAGAATASHSDAAPEAEIRDREGRA
ncbi:DUF3263 domain-containing protein [Galactobacter sp.]|uniref:DUF3263 domain-containing protein n=1 Tax=Galactobacter sp. TaxID=2676125 RepID=UPI0025BFF3ED|nr:DUF3263 domain-containing protein [Galactobacter sp.]